MSGIFDTHAHYDDESFDEDRAALLSSLPSKGVELVMNCATNPSSVKSSLALAKEYDFIYAAIGFHPEDLNPLRLEQLDDIKRLAQSESKVKAIGEIGLDYYWKEVPPEKQIKDDLANRVNIRSPAYLGGRVGVELFGRCPVPCIGKKCTAVIIHVSDAVKVDKLHKLCYCIIRGILQDKYVFGLQVKAEKT